MFTENSDLFGSGKMSRLPPISLSRSYNITRLSNRERKGKPTVSFESAGTWIFYYVFHSSTLSLRSSHCTLPPASNPFLGTQSLPLVPFA